MAKYAQYYDYITDKGIIVPDVSTVLAETQNEMRDLFNNQDLDVGPSTAQGRIIEMIQRSRTFAIYAMVAVSNMLNLNRASGFFLDDIGSLFLLSRTPATRTRTTVILSGVTGTIVPAGTRFKSVGGDIFALVSNFTIGSGGIAIAEAQETGPVPCPPNTLTTILDAVSGLETVINPGQPTIGTDLESDAAFRARIQNGLNINSITILSAIKANLEAIPGVRSSLVIDNDSNGTMLVDGISIPAHTILAVVDGGDEEAIAKVLYDKKSIGAGYYISTDAGLTIKTVSVTDPAYGTEYQVSFARPDEIPFDIEITVDRKTYSGSDLSLAVKNAIIAWAAGENEEVDGLTIGGLVSPFEIAAAVSNTLPEIQIREVKVAKHGGTLGTASISLDRTQKASIISANINVKIWNETA